MTERITATSEPTMPTIAPETVRGALLIRAVAKRPSLKLSPRSVDVLMRMCASAVDPVERGPRLSGTYYGGWVPLLLTLGFDPPAPGAPIGDNARQAIRRALAQLIDAGLVEPLDEREPKDPRDRCYRVTI